MLYWLSYDESFIWNALENYLDKFKWRIAREPSVERHARDLQRHIRGEEGYSGWGMKREIRGMHESRGGRPVRGYL